LTRSWSISSEEDLGVPLTEAQRAFRALWLNGPIVN
jgi:hypothetical protein